MSLIQETKMVMRKHLGQTAFLRRLSGLRPDDIFVYSDAEDLVRPEILQFLKLYDGYDEPVAFNFRWAIYGYFWTVLENQFGDTHALLPATGLQSTAMSVAFFRDFQHYDASFGPSDHYNNHNIVKFETQSGIKVKLFKIAQDSGWRCSWCYRAEEIHKKLLQIPAKDLDSIAWMMKEKYSVLNIRGFIKYGLYFDHNFMRGGNGTELTKDQDLEFAPGYMLQNIPRFSYLLSNPYVQREEETISNIQDSNTQIDLATRENASLADSLDEKIRSYWNAIINPNTAGSNSSTSANNSSTFVDRIDERIKSYWNSIHNKILPNYIKWTQ